MIKVIYEGGHPNSELVEKLEQLGQLLEALPYTNIYVSCSGLKLPAKSQISRKPSIPYLRKKKRELSERLRSIDNTLASVVMSTEDRDGLVETRKQVFDDFMYTKRLLRNYQ